MKNFSFLKKITAVFISTVMLISSMTVTVSAASDFETAEKAVSSIGVGWNLGNALDSCGDWIEQYTAGKPSDYETAWGNPVTSKKLITAVKKAGFDAVRVPVTWDAHTDSKGNIDGEWLDRVQEIVDYVISQGLYCILDVHHDAGSDGWLEASAACYKKYSARFAGLWKNIAVRFKDYDDKLIFEGFNEMLDSKNSWTDAQTSDAYKAVNDFNQLFVDTVRKTGGNNAKRNLMVQVYSGSCSQKSLAGFTLPQDTVKNHLIVSVHNYDPQGFTASDATWTTMTDEWGTDAEKAYFDKLFERLAKFSKEQGAPLIVGEFAADYKNNDSARKAYAQYFVTAAEKQGIKCFWWDTGNMALFDRSKCTITHSSVVKALTGSAAASSSSSSSNTTTSSSDKPVVTATVKSGNVVLKWNGISGADAYRVYQYDTTSKKYVKVKTVKGCQATIKELSSGSYKFIVCAVEKSGSKYKKTGDYSKAVKVTVS